MLTRSVIRHSLLAATLVVAWMLCLAPRVPAQTAYFSDGFGQWLARSVSSAPAGNEQGLVVWPIPNGTQAVSGPLTDTQLRAAAVPVSGTFWPGTQPVSGPLTDGQLRATAVPVSGAFWQTTQPVSGAITASQGGAWSFTCISGCSGAVQSATYLVSVEASAAAASKDYLSIFNASGSGRVLRVLSVTINPDLAAAVTGLVQSFDLVKTSTTGTTCTAVTIRAVDVNNAAVPAQVTANTNCTTDPTTTWLLAGCAVDGEDARSAVASAGNCYTFRASGGQPWTFREGEGMSIRSSALSGAWPVTLSLEMTL